MLTFLEPNAQTENPLDFLKPLNNKKPSDAKPKEYLLGIAARIKDENESERAMQNARDIVMMCRRHRGMLPSDLFGFWQNGMWMEHPSYAQLHGTNVFQSLIRGAEANFVQAAIRLDIRANANNFQNRSVERISKGIYEILNERQWTEIAVQSAFYAAILQLNAFFISRYDREKGEKVLPVPQFEDISYEQGATFLCTECYESGDASMFPNQTCPSCGSETLSIMDEPEQVADETVSGFEMEKGGECELVVAGGLDVSVDETNGKPADIKSCHWVEWRYLADKTVLKRLYPHLKLESAPDWSYQTRLKLALKRYESGECVPLSKQDKVTYEVRQIWLDLCEYEDYVAPADFKLGDKVILSRGEAFKDKYPKGMVFLVVNNEIADIDGEDKNNRISASLWLSDGINFAGLGAKAGLLIQKKINHLDNMAMEGEARSLKGSILYDPDVIDGAKLEGASTNIPKRTDSATPLKEAVFPLEVTGLSQYSLMYLASQQDTMQRIMGVPDVTLGMDTGDDTYGGQALKARNAVGLLVPATSSAARAKELWLAHQLDIIQSFYAPEALKQFGSRYGEEWTDDEIEAFFKADLEKAITISFVPGSEVPESRFEKQMRLRQDISAGFIQPTPEVLSRLASESGYEGFDVGDYEANEKLAKKRFTFLKETIQSNQQIDLMFGYYEQMLTDPMTGMKVTDEFGNPVPNPVVMQMLNAPQMKIYNESENHSQMMEFWAGQVRELAASAKDASPVLIAVSEAMQTKHTQAAFEVGMKQQTLLGLQQMPNAMSSKMMLEDGEQKDEKQSAKKPTPKAESQTSSM